MLYNTLQRERILITDILHTSRAYLNDVVRIVSNYLLYVDIRNHTLLKQDFSSMAAIVSLCGGR